MVEDSVREHPGPVVREVMADLGLLEEQEDSAAKSKGAAAKGKESAAKAKEGAGGAGLADNAAGPAGKTEVSPDEKRESPPAEPADPLQAMEEITSEHRRLWGLISRKLELGLRKRDPKKGLEHLKAIKLAGDILSVVVRGQRQAWGLEALEGSLAPDDTEEIIEEMASLTATSGADKALDRG